MSMETIFWIFFGVFWGLQLAKWLEASGVKWK